jgi:endoglucanase
MRRRTVLKYLGLSSLAAIAETKGLHAQGSVTGPPSPVLSQIGYAPGWRKIATLPAANSAKTFRIVAENDPMHSAFEGSISEPITDALSGDSVVLADFSRLTRPGKYHLISGQLKSNPFPIDPASYTETLRTVMLGFHGQRCGTEVTIGPHHHVACHANGAYHATSGKTGPFANTGGWHDAGDYGRYIVNSGISTGTLLWAWELYPHQVTNLHLNIPESGGKMPDYLAEIRWNLAWMLSMQDSDGGVWHKQTSEQFCAFVMPEQDTLTSYVIGTGLEPYKSTCATADLASVAAIAARCYAPFEPTFAQQCLEAAKKAWKWAQANPNVPFHNPPGIKTGEYGDNSCSDELLWASAELWRTTGDAQYEQAFLAAATLQPVVTARGGSRWVPGFNWVAPMAYWTWLLSSRKSTNPSQAAPLRAKIIEQTQQAAQNLADSADAGGYGTTMSPEQYNWGSNGTAANQSLLLLIADHLQPTPRFREAALGNLHYLLGRNCFGISWVTGVGTNPFLHPHHRPSAADGIEAPWPGLLSGGPNARPADEIARTVPKQPPMRMWIDDQRAYSMNEIAINWNAPLVFLLAAACNLA